MKKLLLVLLLVVPMAVQAQKISITTSNGLKYDIECDGKPANIIVVKDSVILKMNDNKQASLPVTTVAENIEETVDSVDTFVEVPAEEVNDSVVNDSISNNLVTVAPANLADALAQEYIPGFAQYTQEAQSKTALQAVEEAATPILGEEGIASLKEVGETVSWISSLIKPKAGFEPDYLQRKIKTTNKRAYTDVKVFASMGKELGNLFGGDKTPDLNDEYGADADNNANYGAAVQITRQTSFGRTEDGKFIPGPFRLFWGGLAAVDFEKEIGVSADLFGTAGIGIGNEISLELGALAGFAFNGYNTFLTDGLNYMTVTQHKMCFAIGLQACLTFNLSKDVYTGIWGRTAYSFKPSESQFNLQKDFEVEYEDFNTDALKFGVFMGFRMNAPEAPSTDKRLRFTLSYANQFIGEGGSIIAAELERQTQFSPKYTINYGVEVARRFAKNKRNFSSVMLSGGVERSFKSVPRLSLEGKLYAGVAESETSTIITTQFTQIEDISPRICFKGAIQLGCQYRIGKASYLSLAFRLGHFLGSKAKIEDGGLDEDKNGDDMEDGDDETTMFDLLSKQGIQTKPQTTNKINGWQGQLSLGYKIVF